MTSVEQRNTDRLETTTHPPMNPTTTSDSTADGLAESFQNRAQITASALDDASARRRSTQSMNSLGASATPATTPRPVGALNAEGIEGMKWAVLLRRIESFRSRSNAADATGSYDSDGRRKQRKAIECMEGLLDLIE